MTTTTTTTTLAAGDKVWSVLHQQWVRFSHMVDSAYAAVTDGEGRELSDYVHLAHLLAAAPVR